MTESSDLKPEVVVAVVLRDDGRVLLVRRRKAEGTLRWSFPGGKIEKLEHEADASQREVMEEAGILCKAIRKIGQWKHPDTHKVITYWWCKHESGVARPTEPEIIDRVEWVPPGAVFKKVTSRMYPKLEQELRSPKKLEPTSEFSDLSSMLKRA